MSVCTNRICQTIAEGGKKEETKKFEGFYTNKTEFYAYFLNDKLNWSSGVLGMCADVNVAVYGTGKVGEATTRMQISFCF